jgi:hypothetical protein
VGDGGAVAGVAGDPKGYQYARLGAYVRFDAATLKNPRWEVVDNAATPLIQFVISNHVCGYQCYVSMGIDEKDLCTFYWETDKDQVPMRLRCNVPNAISQQLQSL